MDRLLAAGAKPGPSRYAYSYWYKLLVLATRWRFQAITDKLGCAIRVRFGFEPRFPVTVKATKECDYKRVESLLTADQ